ncbi:hypothetical protein LTR60_006849, partial [Cryomyces antarcticus]
SPLTAHHSPTPPARPSTSSLRPIPSSQILRTRFPSTTLLPPIPPPPLPPPPAKPSPAPTEPCRSTAR